MNELRISIGEISSLSNEDAEYRVRERIIDMEERIGSLPDALRWLWKDIAARQGGSYL